MVRIATRDASWWRNPDVDSVKRAHVIGADGVRSACGNQMLDVEAAWDFREEDRAIMCRRRACQNALPDQVTSPSTEEKV